MTDLTGIEFKHAYLIIAHKNDLTFQTLLQLLDDPRNDIFIHMDIKNKEYDPETVIKFVKKANVFHTLRTNVTWGGYSQIKSELLLLNLATSTGHYKYYHLLSGEDLPIKSQDFIHNALRNSNYEYIGFSENQSGISYRVNLYHLFQEKIGRKKCYHWNVFPFKVLNFLSIKIQHIFGVCRNKGITFYKGLNWFSITDAFARYVVSKEKTIYHIYRWTYCADELFLQTLLMNSSFKSYVITGNEFSQSLRLIDWSRGNPYIYKQEDYNSLISSDRFWARKFNAEIDSAIIKNIFNYLTDK